MLLKQPCIELSNLQTPLVIPLPKFGFGVGVKRREQAREGTYIKAGDRRKGSEITGLR